MMQDLADLFRADIHRPYRMEGGPGAVLLVHGFPGTPAETRAAAAHLNRAGWTTRGLLLPGFGPELDRLLEQGASNWVDAVSTAIAELRETHSQVILLGYSFGGAVALQAAAKSPPDALVLAAPMTRLGGLRARMIWAVVKRIFPRLRPFGRLDFGNSEVRAGMRRLFPGLEVDAQTLQSLLAPIEVPAAFVEEVVRVGVDGLRAAKEIDIPVLILQGERDETIPADSSRKLAAEFPRPPAFRLLPVGHELLDPDSAAFEEAMDLMIKFLER